MKIAGLQKTSLIDYPEKIVSIIFTQGCNFRCPYCHNPDLIPSDNTNKEYFPFEYLFEFIKERKGLIDGVSITGGEPTLQKGLLDLIIKIKSMGLIVKLDTNGSNPLVIKELLQNKLLDYIAMDIKGPLERYEEIIGQEINTSHIKKSITLIMSSDIDYEFRTTVVPSLHSNVDFPHIGEAIKGAKKYFIQNFKPNNTFAPHYLRLNGFSVSKLEEFKQIMAPYVQSVTIRD